MDYSGPVGNTEGYKAFKDTLLALYIIWILNTYFLGLFVVLRCKCQTTGTFLYDFDIYRLLFGTEMSRETGDIPVETLLMFHIYLACKLKNLFLHLPHCVLSLCLQYCNQCIVDRSSR